jgi:hypothetical protein
VLQRGFKSNPSIDQPESSTSTYPAEESASSRLVEPVVRKSFKLLGEQRTIGWYESASMTALERPHEELLLRHKLRDGDLYIHKAFASQLQNPQTWVWNDGLADWQVISIGERIVIGGAKREFVIRGNGRPYWKKVSVV